MLSETNKKYLRYPKSLGRVIPNYSSHVVQGPEADLEVKLKSAPNLSRLLFKSMKTSMTMISNIV